LWLYMTFLRFRFCGKPRWGFKQKFFKMPDWL
jgi:hypothetical protein